MSDVLEFEGIKFAPGVNIKMMGERTVFYSCTRCGATVMWFAIPQGDVLLIKHAQWHGG